MCFLWRVFGEEGVEGDFFWEEFFLERSVSFGEEVCFGRARGRKCFIGCVCDCFFWEGWCFIGAGRCVF